jgi:hypothetical protein
VAETIRAKYRGKDTGEGLPYFHGIPSRDLTDVDFDNLDDEQKATVRSSTLYDYVPYTERSRSGEVAKSTDQKKDGEAK